MEPHALLCPSPAEAWTPPSPIHPSRAGVTAQGPPNAVQPGVGRLLTQGLWRPAKETGSARGPGPRAAGQVPCGCLGPLAPSATSLQEGRRPLGLFSVGAGAVSSCGDEWGHTVIRTPNLCLVEHGVRIPDGPKAGSLGEPASINTSGFVTLGTFPHPSTLHPPSCKMWG